MSVSRHPVALRLEGLVGDGTKLLATVMALPLIDGIFPALLLAGAVDSPLGILEVGLLIFGGSATLAVVLAEMEGTRREQVQNVLLVGIPLLVLAGLEAAIAPTIESMLRMEIFTRFAALVILAVAAKTASATIGEYLPSPGTVILLGLVASLDLSNVTVTFVADPMLVVRGVAAAGVGVGFALSVAVFGPWLRGAVDIDRFRFGSAVALGVLVPSAYLWVADRIAIGLEIWTISERYTTGLAIAGLPVEEAAFFVVMNQDTYDNLPEDVQQVIDEMSGETLVAKLREEGLEDNTFVFFTSDNGPWKNIQNPKGISQL